MIKRLLPLLLLSVAAFGQNTITTICNTTAPSTSTCTVGSTFPAARGFNWVAPYDPINDEVLYFGGDNNASTGTIYSFELWGYSTHTHQFTRRVAASGISDNYSLCGCATNSPAPCGTANNTTANPLGGHPLGNMTIDTIRNVWMAEGGLCLTMSNGYTSLYNLNTRTMKTPNPSWGFISHSSCARVALDGTFYGCSGDSFNDGIIFVPSAGYTYKCCHLSGTSFYLAKFDGSDTNPWVDISSGASGTLPPYLNAAKMITDGTYIYLAFGCIGSTPNNGSGSNACTTNGGTNSYDIYRAAISGSGNTTTWTKLTISDPSNLLPGSMGNFPMIDYDSIGNRFLYYANTNTLLQIPLSTLTVSQVATTGNGPVFTSTLQNGSQGNTATFVPSTNTFVLMYVYGQDTPPGIFEVSLAGSGVSSVTNLLVKEATVPNINGPNTSGLSKATSSVARTSEPITQGVPLADSLAVSGTSPQLGFTGTGAPTSGQFTCIQQWPSGHCKWVLVSTIVPSLSAGTEGTITLSTGTGNFGGSDLATDGTTISVNTGTATFTIKKTNFNVIDSAVINSGSVTLVSSGASDGIVITGPSVGNTACSYPPTDCSTEYKSKDDASSTASIVENGPVKAVIKASGTMKNGTQAYLKYTLWMTFYKGQSSVRYTLALRNADESTATPSFTNAYKMFKSAEIRLALTLGSSKVATFSTDTTNQTYSFSGTESAFKFQAFSTRYWTQYAYQTVPVLKQTTGTFAINGMKVIGNGSTIYSNTKDQYDDAFWGDVNDSNGHGVQVAVFEGDAYWPKTLEYRNGGSDLRIGIFPDQSLVDSVNAIPYVVPYPQHQMTEGFINFHASALSSANNEALKYQAPLVMRPPIGYVNSSKVFPVVTLVDSSEINTYIDTTIANANPAMGGAAYNHPTDHAPETYTNYHWGGTGGGLNTDNRWDYMTQFIVNGWTGRYLWAKANFKYAMENLYPRADGFRWSSHSFTDISGTGYPYAVVTQSANLSSVPFDGGRDHWCDQYHCHTEGTPDWYYFTGDYAVKAWLEDSITDHYSAALCQNLAPGQVNSLIATCSNNADVDNPGGTLQLPIARALGAVYSNAARLHSYYANGPTKTVNDSALKTEYESVFEAAYQIVSPDTLISGTGTGNRHYGTSRTRGVLNTDSVGNLIIPGSPLTPYYCNTVVGTSNYLFSGAPSVYSGTTTYTRIQQPLGMGILMFAIDEVLAEMGTSWNRYQTIKNLELGWAQWFMNDASYNDGSGLWMQPRTEPSIGAQDPYSHPNGVRHTTTFDVVVNPTGSVQTTNGGGFCENEPYYGLGEQESWYAFVSYLNLTGDTNAETLLKYNLLKLLFHGATSDPNAGWDDRPGFHLANAIYRYAHPPTTKLQTVAGIGGPAFTTFTNNGGGSYTLGWSNISGTTSLELRYSSKNLVDWLNFSNTSGCDVTGCASPGIGGVWGLSPTTNQPWFSATATATQPSVGASSITVTGLPTGLTSSNFMLKANGTPVVGNVGGSSIFGKIKISGKSVVH